MDITQKSKKPFWARPRFIIWTVIIILLVTIMMQNVEPTSIDILFWSLPALPKLVVILISMVLGGILALLAFYHARRNRNTYTPE